MWSSFYSEKCQQCNTQIHTMQADAYNQKITWHAMDSSQAASFECKTPCNWLTCMDQHLSCGIQKGKHVFIASLLVPNSATHSLCWTSFSCEPQQVQRPQSLWHSAHGSGIAVISNGHQQYIQRATDSAVPMQGNAVCLSSNS